MPHADADNPYRAPEASITALRDEIRRPPVYTVVSIFCWVLGVYCSILFVAFAVAIGQRVMRHGWRWLILATNNLKILSLVTLVLLCAIAYVAAGRLLWARRGRRGLSFCGAAIGMTYLAVWIYTRR